MARALTQATTDTTVIPHQHVLAATWCWIRTRHRQRILLHDSRVVGLRRKPRAASPWRGARVFSRNRQRISTGRDRTRIETHILLATSTHRLCVSLDNGSECPHLNCHRLAQHTRSRRERSRPTPATCFSHELPSSHRVNPQR